MTMKYDLYMDLHLMWKVHNLSYIFKHAKPHGHRPDQQALAFKFPFPSWVPGQVPIFLLPGKVVELQIFLFICVFRIARFASGRPYQWLMPQKQWLPGSHGNANLSTTERL